ncbi:MAG: type II toxin-antitoxin system RelE/ParE family toxin [Planctomycetes bacterium]|nr:type II toxin-antitoxin system RelE/ParE family toxin [Planctomycetota bacterium]
MSRRTVDARRDRLQKKIKQRLLRLKSFPKTGAIPVESELSELGYRFVIVDNYLIFYTVGTRIVTVHRILHGARDYLTILK